MNKKKIDFKHIYINLQDKVTIDMQIFTILIVK